MKGEAERDRETPWQEMIFFFWKTWEMCWSCHFCHQKHQELLKDTPKSRQSLCMRASMRERDTERERERCACFDQHAWRYALACHQGRFEHLALVSGEAVVEVLSLRTLGPLGIGWLLTTTVASCALGSAVSHRLCSVTGRGLSSRAGKVAMLTAVLT